MSGASRVGCGLILAGVVAGCGFANDFDAGRIPEPPPPPPEDTLELCSDGLDNDGDGQADCDAASCDVFDHCDEHSEAACSDGADNDGDGLLDCVDPPCRFHTVCHEASAQACDDGIDNDKDGALDCYDPVCKVFPPCLEDSEGTCVDGRDNDLNGSVDCEDRGCALTAACFSEVPLVRDEPCGDLRGGVSLSDDFDDGIDPTVWHVHSTGGADRPRTVGGELDLHCTDNWFGSTLASRARFRVGRSQPFSLTFRVRMTGACHADPDRCRVAVHLHTRQAWGDGLTGGKGVLGLNLRSTEDGEGLEVECGYHGRALDLLDGGVVALDGRRSTDVRIATDEETGAVRFSFGGGEELECDSGPILDEEPETALVFDEGCLRDQPGALLFDDVRLEVEPQRRLERCQGLRAPLLADTWCTDSFYSGGTREPEILEVPEGFLMLFEGHHWPNHNDVGAALSADGRHDWQLVSPDPLLSPHVADYWWRLGAAAYSPDFGELRIWAEEDPADGPSVSGMWRASASALTEWERVGDLSLDGETSAPRRDNAWSPDTVLLADSGGYVGWFTSREGQGVSVIRRATSDDGLAWVSDESPALIGDVGAWDHEGVGQPSVRRSDAFYVMAYASPRFDGPTGIGLAISRDGRFWTKHRSNPVIEAGEEAFDQDSLGAPLAIFDGDLVRVWYMGHTAASRPCRGDDVGGRQEVGLAELYLPE